MIAILAAKQKANQASCLNNVKQITLAAVMYYGDYGTTLSYDVQLGEKRATWMGALINYYSSANLHDEFASGENSTKRLSDPDRDTDGPDWLGLFARDEAESTRRATDLPPGWTLKDKRGR